MKIMSGFDYFTIIGKSPSLFKAHVTNLLKKCGLERDKWTFNVIIYTNPRIPKHITDELVDISKNYDIKFTFYNEWHNNFLHNLYACWNLCQELGERSLTLRAGSDQFFSQNFFKHVLDEYEKLKEDAVLQTHTVESILSPQSRHFVRDFGTTFNDFKEKEFDFFCQEISRPGLFNIKEALDIWGKPTSFSCSISENHNRLDSCTWLQSKNLFKKFGPMPPIEGRWTGDVIIHDRYERAGIKTYLVGNAITYHLVRSEASM